MSGQSYAKSDGIRFAGAPGNQNFASPDGTAVRQVVTGRLGATITSVSVHANADWSSSRDVVLEVLRKPYPDASSSTEVNCGTITVPKDAKRGDVFVRYLKADCTPGSSMRVKIQTNGTATCTGLTMLNGYNWPSACAEGGAAKGGDGVGKVYLVEG